MISVLFKALVSEYSYGDLEDQSHTLVAGPLKISFILIILKWIIISEAFYSKVSEIYLLSSKLVLRWNQKLTIEWS